MASDTMTSDTAPAGDADIASIAEVIGHRSRAKVLMALTDGRALPAGVLASEAGVAPSTISEHLGRLLEAGLVGVEQQGRARYYRLANADVAAAVEALARVAPAQRVTSLRQGNRAYALRAARTCYNHLAGRLGCALMTALVADDVVVAEAQDGTDQLSAPGTAVRYVLTGHGREVLTGVGVDVATAERRHPAVRYCMDWTEQRHHLAGPLGAALTARLFALGWLARTAQRRAVALTARGARGLTETFGVEVPPDLARRH